MKKLTIALLMAFTFISPASHALDATGTIDEIRWCGTGTSGWYRTLLFKVDDKWFGSYIDYYAHSTADIDNNITASMVMMAFSANNQVEVRFTGAWDTTLSTCGPTAGGVFNQTAGDYISITR